MRKLTLIISAALGAFALAACVEEPAEEPDTESEEGMAEDAETEDQSLGPTPEETTGAPETRSAETAGQPGAGEIGEGGEATPQTLTVMVAQNADYGEYLTDNNGRPLYMFTADTKGDGGAAQITCAGECLENWPLATSDAGAPQAGPGVDEAMLATIEADGQTVVTYNGWPLYYFASDSGPGEPQGNEIESFGGQWFLVTPDGDKVGQTQQPQ